MVRSFTSTTYGSGLFYSRVCNTFAAYIPILFFHFCVELINNRNKKQEIAIVFGYINCAFITAFALNPLFIPAVKSITVFKYYADPGLIYYYYTFHFFLFALLAEIALIRSQRSLSYKRRNQIRYVALATTFGFITGGATFLPVFNVNVNPYPAHFMWLYMAVISYAIVRHNLLDIKIVLRKGLVYSALISLITAIYFAMVFIASFFFQNITGFNSWPAVLIIFTVVAVIFKPLERRIQSIVDRLLYVKSAELLTRENQMLLAQVQHQDRLKAVATLAAGMAHEIKNPLTAIKIFAEHLPTKYNDPDFRDKFKGVMVKEVDRVNNIVQQLLDFSKPKDPELKPASVQEILEETLNLLNSSFLSHRIEVVRDYKADPKLLVDRNQLKQAFLNLLLNALQAMPNGGTLTVSTFLNGKDEFVVSIADTGVGIPEDQLAHIFDPFFTTKEAGTGLGLSIVHGIVTRHGGKINVQSALGQGTRFTINLGHA